MRCSRTRRRTTAQLKTSAGSWPTSVWWLCTSRCYSPPDTASPTTPSTSTSFTRSETSLPVYRRSPCYRSVFNASVWIVAEHGRIRLCNACNCTLLGKACTVDQKPELKQSVSQWPLRQVKVLMVQDLVRTTDCTSLQLCMILFLFTVLFLY